MANIMLGNVYFLKRAFNEVDYEETYHTSESSRKRAKVCIEQCIQIQTPPLSEEEELISIFNRVVQEQSINALSFTPLIVQQETAPLIVQQETAPVVAPQVLRRSTRVRKSTQHPDFIYYTYNPTQPTTPVAAAPVVVVAPQVVAPLRRSTRIKKSTRHPDFIYY